MHSRRHLTKLLRTAAIVVAGGAGILSATLVANVDGHGAAATAGTIASSPGPVAEVARGRTLTPRLDHGSYLVRAGTSFRVNVRARAVWGHPRSCAVSVTNGNVRQTFAVRGVVADFSVTFPTARHARQGTWQLTVGCAAPGHGHSHLARATVLVASSARAHGALIGHAKPDIEASQALRPVQQSQVGVGGYPPNPGFPNGQCTYFAYTQRPDIYWTSRDNGAPAYGWNADMWSVYAAQYGHFTEGSTPAVGAVMVEPASSRSAVGHVAYVVQVIDGSHWVTQEMNTDGRGIPGKVFTVYNQTGSGPAYFYSGGQLHRNVVPGTVFIYGGKSTTPPTETTPTTTVTQTTTVTTTTTTPVTTTTTTPPPPQTWAEAVGGNANTWTNYTNAGGNQGPTIPAYTSVQIACAVQGFRVADGNTWWYRIASSPWNNAYYVSADAFYNNGQTSGSLVGTPFVDPAVAGC